MIDLSKIPLDDQKTWDMICEGRVIGVFQIESRLASIWCQQVLPRSIEELAAVISLVRPGCLKAIEDGKSLTKHYADRKTGVDEIVPIHPVVDKILEPTYNILVYQEQSIKLATECAGFTPEEADTLRKATGKKIASLMSEVKKTFLEKAVPYGVVDQELAEKLFSWIEKSNRYSFNKCCCPLTIVETKDGLKVLDEICIGDSVLGPTKDGDKFIEVTDVIDSGEKELVEIELDNGRIFRCSIDHKFLCEDGEVRPLWEILQDNHSIGTQPE